MPPFERKDSYYIKAKKDGYPARSAYKLLELDKKFGILKPKNKIIDLGCAPGGWLKVAEEKIIPLSSAHRKKENQPTDVDDRTAVTPSIIGIDLLPLQYQPQEHVCYFQGDFLERNNQQKILDVLQGRADWVISDMSPNITGIKFKDTAASVELCEAALTFSKEVLKTGGGLVVKIFPGPELEAFKKDLKQFFQKIVVFIPESTRKTSTEVYLVSSSYQLRTRDNTHSSRV